MTPSAHHQKTIELLDYFWSQVLPLDRFLKKNFQASRYMGSSDRKNLTQMMYGLLRDRQKLIEGGAKNAREEVLLFLSKTYSLEELTSVWSGQNYQPAPLTDHEISLVQSFTQNPPTSTASLCNVPSWVLELSPLKTDIWTSLNTPAPVDIWVHEHTQSRSALKKTLTDLGYAFEDIQDVATGLRATRALQLDQTNLYKEGAFEFQDGGSQAITLHLPYPKAGKILELCAGAGGKTLNLAASLPKEVRLFATDIEISRLERTLFRLNRAKMPEHVTVIDYHHRYKGGAFEGIFIDAPCSGTGVWRRKPEDRWRLSPETIDELKEIQKNLLLDAASHITPNGWIAYSTCSILECENEDIINSFLESQPDFQLEKNHHWNPLDTGTDGFFLSILRKISL